MSMLCVQCGRAGSHALYCCGACSAGVTGQLARRVNITACPWATSWNAAWPRTDTPRLEGSVIRAYVEKHTHSHAHTHTHARVHAHARARAHTHTLTHTCSCNVATAESTHGTLCQLLRGCANIAAFRRGSTRIVAWLTDTTSKRSYDLALRGQITYSRPSIMFDDGAAKLRQA